MAEYNDYPLHECAAQASEHMRAGAEVFQKFTCRFCGSRQTMETPNVFYTSGRCEECNQITVIQNCNYAMIMKVHRP
jgi:hypothetical protein